MNTVVPHTSSAAIISLIFGILSWCMLPLVGALVAIVTGHVARSDIRQAPAGSIEGNGMALAGLILGYLQLLIGILTVVAAVLFFGGLALLAGVAGN